MMRFIDIGEQVYFYSDDFKPRCIAFFDTINSRFIELGVEQTWDSFEDFEEEARDFGMDTETIERLRGLTPETFLRREKGAMTDG